MGDAENTPIIASKVIYTVKNTAITCPPGQVNGNHRNTCVPEVHFYPWHYKAGFNLAAAQEICFENGWVLATTEELRAFWGSGYSPFKAYGGIERRPQLSVNAPVFSPNSPIQVSYTDGPGNSKDWVGIFPKGAKLEVTPTTITYEWPTVKAYVEGASGTLEFSLPDEGEYFLAFFKDDNYLEIAERVNILVTTKPQFFVNAFEFRSGTQVEVGYINGRKSSKDWVGIFPAGTTPGKGNPIGNWAYVEAPSGTLKLSLPEEGAHFIAFFRDNSYEEVADRIDIAVLANPKPKPQLSVDSSTVYTGEAIKVTYTSGPGYPDDWVGIYRKGQTPQQGNSGIQWAYITGSSGTLEFSLAEEGAYFIAFFQDGTYVELADRVNITVEKGKPQLSVDSKVANPKEPIKITYSKGPGNAKDWVGIYRKGDTPGKEDATIWKYVEEAGNLISGSMTLSAPADGAYFIGFFKQNSYEELADRVNIFVGAVPRLSVESVVFLTKDPIRVSYDFDPGHPKDWVGIYRKEDTPGKEKAAKWKYTGTPSGTLEFSLTEEGVYFIAFFQEDGYEEMGERIEITVTSELQSTNEKTLPFAYGMLADGTFAVPVQRDYTLFKRGLNIGASGGNEGFFYVLASAVDRTQETTQPSNPGLQGQLITIARGGPDPITALTMVHCDPVHQERNPAYNWMIDMWIWEKPLTVSSKSILVEAAKAYLRKKQLPVNDAMLLELAASVKADPVARYKFAPFLLMVCFRALLAEQPTEEQQVYKSYFENYQSCVDYTRAVGILREWNDYQGKSYVQSPRYLPNTLSNLNFDNGPSVEGFLMSDPLRYGQKGGETVALLYFPMGVQAGLWDDFPLSDIVGELGDDMMGAVAGVGSSVAVASLMVGSTYVFQKVQYKLFMKAATSH